MTGLSPKLTALLTGRYRVDREVGAGGMATVFLAEDTKHNRRVAVKVLRPELAASLGAERFLREIAIAAQLQHPHILGLYDSGGADDVLFYVMPFVEGQSLRDRLAKSGALPMDEALRIIREVADALAYSHEHGVVHRDIKPENILLSGAHALVTDFGVAKAVSDATSSAHLTSTGMALGTPSYMAPEQAMADPTVDHRADIYALGVMAYEIIAGQAPFLGANPQQVLAGHLTKRPEPLSSLRHTVPPALEAAVMRCLEKNPADRWQSAAELLHALDLIATASAVGGPRVPTRRWRRMFVGLAAVAVAGALGLGWFARVGRAGTLIGDDLLAENDIVLVSEFQNHTADSSLASTVTDAIRVELQQSHAVRVMSQAAMWSGLTRMGLAHGVTLPEDKVQELAEREGAKAFVVGDIARLGGGYQITARVVATTGGREALTARATAQSDAQLIGAVETVGRTLRKQIGESLRSVWSAPPLAQVTTASLAALRAYSAGGRAEEEGERLKAIALAKQALALDTAFAGAWGLLYVSYSNMGSVRLATEAAVHAYQLRDRLSEVERLRVEARYHAIREERTEEEAAWSRLAELGRDETNYANMLLEQGRLPEAEAMARRGVASTPKSTIAYWNLAEAQVALRHFGGADSTLALIAARLPESQYRSSIAVTNALGRHDFDAAEAFLRSADAARFTNAPVYKCLIDLQRGRISAWQRCPPSTGPTFIRPALLLAEYRLTGDGARARTAYEKFLAERPDSRNPDDYAIMITLLADVGRVRDAKALLDEWRTRTGKNDPGFRADSAEAVGAVAAADKQWDRALTAFLAWNRAPMPSAFHFYNRGLPEAATILRRLGKPDSAAVLFERALATYGTAGGSIYEAGWYAQALQSLGEMYEERGDRAKAAVYYGKYLDLFKGADAVLGSQVAAVRAKLAKVTGEGGVRP